MRNIRLLLLVFFSFTGLGQVGAQDFKEALLKMRDKLENSKNIHLIMEIKAYVNAEASEPFFTQRAEVKKQENKVHYRLGEMETIINEHYVIWVDHANKRIAGQVKPESQTSDVLEEVMINPDSILGQGEAIELIGSSNGTNHYRVTNNKSLIRQTDIFMTNQGMLKKMIYTYNKAINGEGGLVHIDFKKMDTSAHFELGAFDERKFMTKSQNGFKAASTYKNYDFTFGVDE